MDGKSGICRGCLRTRDEIIHWNKMSDHRRRQVLRDRLQRHTKLSLSSLPSK